MKGVVRDVSAFLPQPGAREEHCDLRQAAEHAVRLARHELVACAEVTVDVPAMPDVAASLDDLVGVLSSLLVNAGQATAAWPNRVRISARRLAGRVEIALSDSGAGMDAGVLAHLFEPFFTTRDPLRQKGLGISRCRAIVDAAGGAIAFESAPGRGTTVRVTLPLVEDAARAEPDPVASA